jgi:O-antigen/teichoic acid export membrane protein
LAFGTAFLTIHNTADPILLDKLSTAQDVSAYGAGLRVLSAMIFLPSVFALITAPEITKRLTQNDLIGGKRLVSRSLKLLLIISTAFSLILNTIPHLIIRILFGGDKFIDIVPLVKITGWTFWGMSFSYFMIEIAIAEGKHWISMVYMLTLMFVSVSLDLLLIPKFGFLGAGYSKAIAVASGSIMVFISSKKIQTFDSRSFLKLVLGISSLTLVILIFIHFSNEIALNEFLQLFGIGLIYISGLHFLRVMHMEDYLNIFKSLTISNKR